MTAQWASRRLITGIIAIALSPVIAAVFSLSGAQGANPPVPVVSLSVPGTPLIGSSVAFDVSFTNTSPTQTGYGPYVDLRLPLGADGNDGLTFTSATYLGATLTTVQLVADAGGCVLHPYAVQVSGAPVQICGLAVGQAYVVLRLPFGSFTPGQPAAIAHVTTQLSDLADASTALTITANGGFQFGATALNDPATDPSVLGDPVSADVHPSIMTVTKTYIGPEDETATGPNYPRSYTLSVTIAAGQTVGSLVIADTLPNSIQYVSTNATTPASSAVLTPLTTTPGGTLSRNFGSVTGTGGVDATMTFNFYVPRLNSVPAAILNATTGAFNTSTDSVSSNGTWTPIDGRDDPGPVSAGPATHTLNDKSIAVQKSVSLATDTGPAGVSPGDTLQWTISTQVSDYFALNNVVVDDLLGDGTLWDGTFTPTLQVNGNTFVSATANINAANYTVSAINGADQTPISFRLSAELITRGQNGRLIGGCVRTTGSATPDCAAYNDGATTATIVFRSVVQETYHNVAHGEVVEGDTLMNQAASTGTVLNTGTFASTGNTIGDGSAGVATAGTSASVSIDRGTLAKTIYAINGSTSFTLPVHVSPGDTLTYRLQQAFPTSRTDDFRMTDYLPLPVFYAAEVITFDAVADETAPAAGHAKYGPDDDFHTKPGAPTPTVSSDITANSVEFLYGNYALYPPEASTADILFTVTVSTDPFADGLLLTNQARSQTKNAVGTIQTADAIVQITLDQPVVAITKGIVGSDNPAAVFSPATTGPVTFTTPAAPPSATCPSWTGGDITTAGLTTSPIDSDVTGLDAGDYVRFAVTLHNTGHANAWKVQVADTLPAGFVAPAGGIDLCIANGAGTAIGTTSAQPETDLFGAGFQLTDGPAGSLEEGVSASGTVNATGTNIVVLTYTLQVVGTAEPSAVITNTASLLDYANDPFASSHLDSPQTDDATATTAPPVTAKILTGTDRTHTADPAVAIGEVATYEVTLTIPEGFMPAATLTDTLDTGLGFVRCTTITASSGLSTSLAGFATACNAPTNPTVAGQVVTFSLGDITNANRDNATPETITITYEAVVQNVAGNTRGTLLNNSAALTWTGGSIAAASADAVRVVEPLFVVTKTASAGTGDSGDTIDYTITIANPVHADGADAFDVHLEDVVPSGMTYQGSFTQDVAGGPPAVTLSDAGAPTLTADWVSFPQGSTAVLHFSVTIDNTAEPSHTFTNTAELTYTGLPGTVSGERTGTGVGPNTYLTSGSDDVDVPPVTLTKTLTWTNLGADANPNVVIGEFVRFRVVAVIPEGRTPSATLVDTLPTNVSNMDLAFLDCESIDAPAAITTSLGEDFSTACMNDASNPALSGRNVTFDLGDIVNSDTDNGTPETITITYRAVVLNTPNNNRGTALQNSAVFNWTGHSSAAAHATLNVIEPRVTVVKSANPDTGDAGDTITYQVTITNDNDANGTDAYDVNWTDTIPAGLTYVPGSLTLFSGPTPDTLDDTGSPTLTATWESSLLKNTAAVLRFQATLDPNVPAATVYRNTASITWTSLPGDHSAPGGLYSPVSNERSGNTGDPGGAVNDYAASNYADVTVNSPAPVKTITNTSLGNDTSTNVVVGEVITYQVALTIPEGTMPAAVLTDTLPAGLTLLDCVSITPSSTDLTTSLSGTSDFSGACGAAAFPAGNPTVNGQVVTFDLGTITNINTDNNSAETITMVYRTVVLNNGTNNRGTLLHNSAVLSWTGHSLTAVSAPDIKVTEPLLTVTKTATPNSGVDAGDEITYRVTIVNDNNTNGADAYDVTWTDTIPAGLTYVADSLTLISGPATTTLVPGAAPILTASWDSSFTKNSTAVIEFKATLDADVLAGRVYHNTASVSWTDLPGDVTSAQSTFSALSTERTGNILNPGGTDNDYRATSNDATVTVTQAVPVKTITNTSLNNDTSTNVVVGEVITYRVTVTIPEGTMNSVTVADTLPAGLALVDCATMPSCITIVRSSTDLSTTLNGGVGNGGFNSAITPGAYPAGNPTVNGQVVTFDLGTITNANSDNGTAETLAITYSAVVLNNAGNNRATTLVNSAVLHWSDDIAGSYTPAAVHAPTVTVQEPLLTVAKVASPATGVDAGDTITYTVTVTNDNNANGTTAYEVTLRDIIPAGLTYVPASLQQTAGAGTNPAVVSVTTTTLTDDTMNATFVSFAKNSTAVIQFQATLDADVQAGHVYHNTANIDWTSLPGDVTSPESTFSTVSTERTGNVLNPGGASNDYRATSNDAIVTVTQPAPAKTLVSTSDTVTTTTRVAIGEVARFQIMVRIPEGVTPNVIIRDTLPAGLRYLNDGTATVALVSTAGTMASSTLSGAGLQVVGDGTWTDHPTFVYPTASVTGGTGGAGAFLAGDAPRFPLGTITNDDSDAGTEVAVLEFNVIVENVAGNQSSGPTSLADTGAIWSDSSAAWTSSNTITLTVAEPTITFAKTVTTTPVDAGDTIVYHILVTNAAGVNVSPAYDVRVLDTVSASLGTPVVTVKPGCGYTDNSSGQSVDVTLTEIDPGTNCWVDITTTTNALDAAALRISNSATGTWTSLLGIQTGERTGIGGVNDYAASSAPADVNLAVPSIAKLGPTSTSLAIGATTTYDLVVTLPEGTTRSLVVTDVLPAGMSAVGYSVVTDAASSGTRLGSDFNGTVTTSPVSSPPAGSGGGAWTLTFGDTITAADNVAGNNAFLIRITGRIANVAGNQHTTLALVNSASLVYTNPQTSLPSAPVAAPQTPTVSIVEPVLQVAKSAGTPDPMFGDVVTYTLTISHTGPSNSTAYDVSLEDTLPAGLSYTAASLQNTAGVIPTGMSESGGIITVTFGSIAVGQTSTITYQASVTDPIPGNVLTNNVALRWTSLSGADANERTGNTSDPGGALNDYSATSSSSVTVSGVDMSITKDDGVTSATVGTILGYALGYHNAGNTTADSVVITEHVPTGTTFRSASSTGSWSCADGSVAGTLCTLSVGSVAADASGSYTFAVRVIDTIPSSLTSIDNTASIAYDVAQNADPTPGDNSASDTDTIPAADLSVTKTVDDSTPDASQIVAFTITVTNTGPATATNVRLTDVLPASLVYASNTPSQGSYVSATGVWTVGSINSGSSATLTLNATVTSSAVATNVVQVTHSDQTDPDSTPANDVITEDDYATATVTPNVADLAVAKTVDNATPDVGSDVTFTITATNNGPDDATGVQVTDALPAGLTYESDSTATGSYNPATHIWTIGGLANGATATLTLVATVATAGPITNTATITGNQYDPDLSNNTDDVSTDQLVDLAVTKIVDNSTANVGTNVTFTVEVTNLGPGTATTVVMQDLLPAGLTWVSDSASVGTSYDHTSGVWTVGTLAEDAEATLTITATVATPSPVTNTASVTSLDEPQVSTANDSASATVWPPRADLAVAKTVAAARPEQGDPDSFTVRITNLGPDTATNVVITDLLPDGLTFTGYTASTGTYDDSTGVWTLGTITNGTTATLTIQVTVDDAADYTNTATVTHSDQYDPDLTNNSDDASLSTRVADIEVTKVPSDATPAVGSTVVFTITATNIGPDNATQLEIHDLLPAGLTYVSATPEAGTAYDPVTGEWTIGNLAVGNTVTLRISAGVVGSGPISNTASVSGLLQRDPDHSNDSATAVVDPPPAADLSLTKTVNVPAPDMNTDVTFTITVTNHGPNGVGGVHVQDVLPAELVYVSHVASSGTYDSATGDWDVGSVANGGHQTLTLVATVTVEGPLANMAQVSAAGLPDPDSTPGNSAAGEDDQASVPINSVGVADLSLVKQVKSSAGIVGGTAVFELVVHNAGPNGAANVIVRDQLPSGVTYVSSTGGAYNAATGAWTVGSLPVGSSATLEITVRIGRTGGITNVAEVVASDQRDPNSIPNDNVPTENDQSEAVLSATQGTPPPTAADDKTSDETGGIALLSLGLALAGMAVLALSFLTARNRINRVYRRRR